MIASPLLGVLGAGPIVAFAVDGLVTALMLPIAVAIPDIRTGVVSAILGEMLIQVRRYGVDVLADATSSMQLK